MLWSSASLLPPPGSPPCLSWATRAASLLYTMPLFIYGQCLYWAVGSLRVRALSVLPPQALSSAQHCGCQGTAVKPRPASGPRVSPHEGALTVRGAASACAWRGRRGVHGDRRGPFMWLGGRDTWRAAARGLLGS